MTELLKFLLRYLDLLYLDPNVRFVDSRSSGHASINAWVVLEAPQVRWMLDNDRGQMRLSVQSRFANADWYPLSLVEQLLEGGPERTRTTFNEQRSDWLGANRGRVEALFADESTSQATCQALEEMLTAKLP